MFHKMLSLLAILESNLIQKNFLYYYILQYFSFMSSLLKSTDLKDSLQKQYLSQLQYHEIIEENIQLSPFSGGVDSSNPGSLFYFTLTRYTRSFCYNYQKLGKKPVSPLSRQGMTNAPFSTQEPSPSSPLPQQQGIISISSSYHINTSILVKDIEINFHEIIMKLLKNESLKKYSYELLKV
jgi:hypothetical protein